MTLPVKTRVIWLRLPEHDPEGRMQQDPPRLIIRRKLSHGDLPNDGISRFWGGPANGETCDACEQTISPAEFIMEGISAITNLGFQLHVECFYLWDEERDEPLRRRLGNR